MRSALRRLLAAIGETFAGPVPVRHRFDPAECRERQKWAAVTASFNPSNTLPRLARGPQERGFE